MAVENVSFGIGTLPQKLNNTVKSANAINEQQRADSVEISSKPKKEKSKAKETIKFIAGLAFVAGMGALVHRFITTRPSYIKKQMAKNLDRKLTPEELAKIDEKCKKSYTGWDFFDDCITALFIL